MVNYLLRLGWSYGDKEIISLNDAIENFKIEKVGKSPSKFDEKKLFFLITFILKIKMMTLSLMKSKNSSFFKIRYTENISKTKINKYF